MIKKIIHIVGPTGIGKTALAFKLAEKFNGELISADSIQVYKNLDIISGKDISANSKFFPLPQLSSNGFYTGYYTHHNIPIFLLDVVDEAFPFSVSQFQSIGEKVIRHISEKNKLPIVVGGTGLYIKSLTEGVGTNSIRPDPALRKSLEVLSIAQLQKKVKNERLFSMNQSDRGNKRRLIRQIELEENQENKKMINPLAEFSHLQIGLTAPTDFLKKRIDERVVERLKNGALKEAENLFKNYDNLVQQVQDANGYKQIFAYLKNEISLEEAIYRWKISEYHHAKNQMTWFRKYGNVIWFDISKKGYEKETEDFIKKFL